MFTEMRPLKIIEFSINQWKSNENHRILVYLRNWEGFRGARRVRCWEVLGAVGTVRILEIDAQDVYRGVDQRIGTGIVDFPTILNSVWLETAKNDEFFDFAPQASYNNFSARKMHPATR